MQRVAVYRLGSQRSLLVAITAVFTAAITSLADDGTRGPGSATMFSGVVGYALPPQARP